MYTKAGISLSPVQISETVLLCPGLLVIIQKTKNKKIAPQINMMDSKATVYVDSPIGQTETGELRVFSPTARAEGPSARGARRAWLQKPRWPETRLRARAIEAEKYGSDGGGNAALTTTKMGRRQSKTQIVNIFLACRDSLERRSSRKQLRIEPFNKLYNSITFFSVVSQNYFFVLSCTCWPPASGLEARE